ncbi:MAG: methyltransferase domain-containing protein [Paracoccaceae bacterium]|nr:methyltransferase domain-containing protein [Paracoccaceae bacterium]MCY4100956.1 methyltransferase domain-containing protein [Paracoccaceae bacterium]MDE2676140.1 methyltransferase domain-containing protein [Paracoccaceae bacterium]MXZ49566.1 class I SAM-dependent methyltransferase [Paracoccaceae bacterium]MYF44924.1 class I SAM-dependent methyltransferase [Paracoccaceae bacterium]
MRPDVTHFNHFYFHTELGSFVNETLIAETNEIWPDKVSGSVLGYGFALPLLGQFLGKDSRIINLMPESLECQKWPAGKPNMSVHTLESNWPLPTASIERAILLHGLEFCENESAMLSECWRVLVPEGLMLIIVPNKSGVWSMNSSTPYGWGRSYSYGQLEKILSRHKLQLEHHSMALMVPPSNDGSLRIMAKTIEKTGKKLHQKVVGGIHLIVARKRIFLTRQHGIGETVKSGLELLKGAKNPTPKPVTGMEQS